MSGVIPVFRPGRRDILLCLTTFFIAWLVFSPSSDSSSISSPSPSPTRTPGSPSSQLSKEDRALIQKAKYLAGGFSLPGLPKFAASKFGWADEEAKEACEIGLGHSVHPVLKERGYSDAVKQVALSKPLEEDDDDDPLTTSGQTSLLAHSPGWTIFENLYLYNGTLWVVTETPADFPVMRLMTSTGLPANGDPGNEAAREPTGEELKYISTKEARDMWEDRIWEMDGMTWLFNDGQFIDHYYHFAAEQLLGAWRAHTSLVKEEIKPWGETSLPPPKRAWFIRHNEQTWRDKPRFNSAILWSAFPSLAVLYEDDWADIKRSTASGLPKAYRFPQALLADRSAAFRGNACPPVSRTVAEAVLMGQPGPWWWEPVRRQVLRFAGTPESILDRSLEGYGAIDPAELFQDPGLKRKLAKPMKQPDPKHRPLVTYISRQSSRRRLTPDSHADLVQALQSHSKANGWDLMVVEAEKMSKEEQLNLAAKTTIMLGVHGNGLTHLLWMPATPQSAVIEMFIRDGFARDYQWTAQHLGIKHFAVRHDTFASAPKEPKVDYPEGFQGIGITVVGEVVAQLIDDRLIGRL